MSGVSLFLEAIYMYVLSSLFKMGIFLVGKNFPGANSFL